MDCDATVSCKTSPVKLEPLVLNDRKSDEETPKKIQTSPKKPRKKKRTPYKEYRCRFCDKFYRNKHHHELHERIHTGERPYKCSVCSAAFRKASNLNEHQRRHLGEKPRQFAPRTKTYAIGQHKCGECQRAFNSKGSLTRHMDTHSTVPNYSCPNCDRKFFHKSTLNRHLLVESGNKKHSCDFCEMKFFDKSDLRKHISMHLGVKKFVCSECGKGFVQSSSLKSHLKTDMCQNTRKITVEWEFIENTSIKSDAEMDNITFDPVIERELREEIATKLPTKRKVSVNKESVINRHKKVKYENICKKVNEEICDKQKLTALIDLIPGDDSDINDIDSDDSNYEDESVYIDTVVIDDENTVNYDVSVVDGSAENNIIRTTSRKASSDNHQQDMLNTEGTEGDKSNDVSNKDVKEVKDLSVKDATVLDTTTATAIGSDKELLVIKDEPVLDTTTATAIERDKEMLVIKDEPVLDTTTATAIERDKEMLVIKDEPVLDTTTASTIERVKELLVIKDEPILDTTIASTIRRDKEYDDDACVIVNELDADRSDVFDSKTTVVLESERDRNTVTSKPENTNTASFLNSVSERETEFSKGEVISIDRENNNDYDIIEINLQQVDDKMNSKHRNNDISETRDSFTSRLEQSKQLKVPSLKYPLYSIKSDDGKVMELFKNGRVIDLPQKNVNEVGKKASISEATKVLIDRAKKTIVIIPENKNVLTDPAKTVKPPKQHEDKNVQTDPPKTVKPPKQPEDKNVITDPAKTVESPKQPEDLNVQTDPPKTVKPPKQPEDKNVITDPAKTVEPPKQPEDQNVLTDPPKTVEPPKQPEDKNVLTDPAEKVNTPKQIVCRHCKMEFLVKREYLKHLRANHFRVKCDKCGVEKRKWREWGEHKCQVCEDCGKVFQSSERLNNHRQRLYICKGCHQTFCTNNSLKIHETTEKCKVIVSCQQCDKTFSTQHLLERHIKFSHEKHERKPFQCGICGFGYDKLKSLKKHYMMHDGKFICKHCKKKCYDKQRLQLHESKCVKSLNVADITNNDTVTKESASNFDSDDEIRSIAKPLIMSKTIDNITNVSDVFLKEGVTGASNPESDTDEDLDLPDIDELSSDNDKCEALNRSSIVCEATLEITDRHNDKNGIHGDWNIDNTGEIDSDSSIQHRTKIEHYPATIDGKTKQETNDNGNKSANRLVVSSNLFGKDAFPGKRLPCSKGRSDFNDCDQYIENTAYINYVMDITNNSSNMKEEGQPSMSIASSIHNKANPFKLAVGNQIVTQNDGIDEGLKKVSSELGVYDIDLYLKQYGVSHHNKGVDSVSSDGDTICQVKKVSVMSNACNRNVVDAETEETMYHDESDSGTDTDSDGYEECTTEEVEAMISKMQS